MFKMESKKKRNKDMITLEDAAILLLDEFYIDEDKQKKSFIECYNTVKDKFNSYYSFEEIKNYIFTNPEIQ